ncbi:MAG: magnesium transporter CorA family protein, partial [Planctomycetota bacterium]
MSHADSPPTRCLAFDFDARADHSIGVADAPDAMASGQFVWIDLDVDDAASLERLQALRLVSDRLLEDALGDPATTHLARFDDYLHLELAACRLNDGVLVLDRVDVFVAEQFLLTTHRGPVRFIERIHETYREDFVRFARSPGFLLFEIFDHLVEHYIAVQKSFEDEVALLQRALIVQADDQVVQDFSRVAEELLHFRKVLLPARELLSDLSGRKSRFVSETTQPGVVYTLTGHSVAAGGQAGYGVLHERRDEDDGRRDDHR